MERVRLGLGLAVVCALVAMASGCHGWHGPGLRSKMGGATTPEEAAARASWDDAPDRPDWAGARKLGQPARPRGAWSSEAAEIEQSLMTRQVSPHW